LARRLAFTTLLSCLVSSTKRGVALDLSGRYTRAGKRPLQESVAPLTLPSQVLRRTTPPVKCCAVQSRQPSSTVAVPAGNARDANAIALLPPRMRGVRALAALRRPAASSIGSRLFQRLSARDNWPRRQLAVGHRTPPPTPRCDRTPPVTAAAGAPPVCRRSAAPPRWSAPHPVHPALVHRVAASPFGPTFARCLGVPPFRCWVARCARAFPVVGAPRWALRSAVTCGRRRRCACHVPVGRTSSAALFSSFVPVPIASRFPPTVHRGAGAARVPVPVLLRSLLFRTVAVAAPSSAEIPLLDYLFHCAPSRFPT